MEITNNNLQLPDFFNLSPYFVDNLGTPGFNWEKFQDKIDALSENLYGLLVDEKTADFVRSLTRRYAQLSVQGPDIARIIRDVILTDIYIGDMPAQISSKLGVDQNMALEIARAIVSQLFAPVIEEIKKLQLQKFGKLPGSSVSQPFPQRPPQHIPGEELPETGGNIIDLRSR
jgi:hypothetical protein